MQLRTTLTLATSSAVIAAACTLALSAPTTATVQQSDWNDARTPISTLPFVIAECGSYYLTDNLTGVAGQHGIEITAADVTIDLNGFRLLGVAGSLDGIHATGDRLRVTGGCVLNWGGDGIDAGGSDSHFRDLILRANGANGLNARDTAEVSRCLAFENQIAGIVARDGSIVQKNICARNGLRGISLSGSFFVAKHNVTGLNNSDGISTTSGESGLLKENTAAFNLGDGLDIDRHHLITNNVCSANGSRGIRAGDGCYVESNVVVYNDEGISCPDNFDDPAVVTRNVAIGNTGVNYDNLSSDDFGPIGTAPFVSGPWANLGH